MAMVLVMSAVAVIIGLRWQYLTPSVSVFDYPGGGFTLPSAEPVPSSELERAPTGDGTTLTLTGRGGSQAMTLQEIYKKVAPSVVSVTVFENRGYAEGTGVIMSANGYIITNAHVIEGGKEAEIMLEDGRSFSALLVGKDTATDLAVLKIDAAGLPTAEFGNSDDMVVGDTVAAIGNPLGQELRGTMTDGILSAINRDMEVDGNQMTLMQTTAALNSGNSGGALVNDQGQVIGITNMKMVQSGFEAPVEGLGFAIPTTTVKAVVD
ncbi:MAG: trypsin-like serine protease, partial [Clostridia bacterium]|nr:trypsin-like serine protease [Clostridia bacterium]